MNKKAGIFSILIFLTVVAIILLAVCNEFENYKENKIICEESNGEIIKDIKLWTSECLIGNELYEIVKTENGKRLAKR